MFVGGGEASPYHWNSGRLTLTSAVPVTTSDVTAATTIYYAPYRGDWAHIFDGTAWSRASFSEMSILTTATQTGTITSGANTITGLSNTTQFIIGMEITGAAGIPANTTIQGITSKTALTMNNNATMTTTAAMTFKLVPSKNYDILLVTNPDALGDMVLQYSNAWTSDSVRADALALQNGTNVNNADINVSAYNAILAKKGTLLGTIRTTSTSGQTEDSATLRLVSNVFNLALKPMRAVDTADSWSYSTASYREANNSTTNRLRYVQAVNGHAVQARVQHTGTSSGGNIGCGIGVDSATVNSAQTYLGLAPATGSTLIMGAAYHGWPGLGFHFLSWLEIGGSGGTFHGDNATTSLQNGITGFGFF